MRTLLAAMMAVALNMSPALARDPLEIKLPAMQIMPGMNTQWVGQRMAVNGVPMQIREFSVAVSPAEVLTWYRRAWQAHGLADILHSRDAGADVLSVGFRGYYQSVRVEPSKRGGARGSLIMSTEPDSRWISTDTSIPLPPLTGVLTRIESIDAGQRSETVQAVTRNSFWFARDHIVHALVEGGWSPIPIRRTQGLPEESALLEFQRGRQHIQVSLQGGVAGKPNHTHIYVQWLK